MRPEQGARDCVQFRQLPEAGAREPSSVALLGIISGKLDQNQSSQGSAFHEELEACQAAA